MKITIWRDRYVRGWTGDPEKDAPDAKGRTVEKHQVAELVEALEASHDSDAHFVPYFVRLNDGTEPASIPRLNLSGFEALAREGHSALFSCVVFDVDDPAAHSGAVESARPQWRNNLAALVDRLPAELSDLATYDTRGGARIVYGLPEPVGPDEYRRIWRGLANRLRTQGIEVDDLKDLTRCYRLPKVVRDGKRSSGTVDLESFGPIEAETLDELSPSSSSSDSGSAFSGIETANAPLVLENQITENRNVTLARLGGVLRRAGLEADEILATLQAVAGRRAPDWNPERGELEHISESVARYESAPLAEAVAPPTPQTSDDLRFVLGSEAELAKEVLAELEVEDVELVYDRTKLFRYGSDRGVWRRVEDSEIRGHVSRWDGEWIGTGGYNADGTPKARPLKVSASLTKGVLDLVEVFRSSKGFFDDAEAGITFRNGFVAVDQEGRVEVSPFRSSQRSTAALPYEFKPGRRPEGFLKTLRECWRGDDDVEEKIELLREFVGACLLGEATQYQKGLIFLGDGANGKSTVQEVVGALFDCGLVTAIPPQEMAQEYRRAMLADSRLNLVNELPEADILVSEAVKAILSGDAIVGRVIREQPFTFRPRCGNLFAANELPGVRDMSRGFWRRWIVLTFGREFTPDEQDPNLAERLIETELAELASWAVEGAARLKSRGRYEIPKSSEEAVAEWRDFADVVSRFLKEKTTSTETARTKASEVYSTYSAWCLANGQRPFSANKLGRRLRRLGVRRDRKRDGFYYYLAIRLSLVQEEEEARA